MIQIPEWVFFFAFFWAGLTCGAFAVAWALDPKRYEPATMFMFAWCGGLSLALAAALAWTAVRV